MNFRNFTRFFAICMSIAISKLLFGIDDSIPHFSVGGVIR